MGKNDMNAVFIIGTLTREPEIKYTPNGVGIANISIANNRVSSSKSGETRESVNYVDVTAFGNTALNVQKYLHKGAKIAVSGSIRQDRWQDKVTGKTVSHIRICADEIQFISQPLQNQATPQPQQMSPENQNPYATQNQQYQSQPPAQQQNQPQAFQNQNPVNQQQSAPVADPWDYNDDEIPF